jgi:hypothetical protein
MTILDKGKSLFVALFMNSLKTSFVASGWGFFLLSFTQANILHGDANQSCWHKRNEGSWWSVGWFGPIKFKVLVKVVEHGKGKRKEKKIIRVVDTLTMIEFATQRNFW